MGDTAKKEGEDKMKFNAVLNTNIAEVEKFEKYSDPTKWPEGVFALTKGPTGNVYGYAFKNERGDLMSIEPGDVIVRYENGVSFVVTAYEFDICYKVLD